MRLFCILFAVVSIAKAGQVKGPNGQIYDDVKIAGGNDGRIEEAEEKHDIFEINEDINYLIDGDVIPKSNSRNTITDTTGFWTSTKVPFQYSNQTLIAIGLEAVGSIELARREYRLRTCLDFVPRTDEENYISFEKRSGCYSYVGMTGGQQTISIGSGCERMATVCHEMMHALGIWHEQSRADRDDYIEVMWDVIDEGKENNFNKYDWEVSDARRVPYDYTSIMHYSDSGFSTTGEPTIVTRDPAFQNVIGQRKTFSRADSTKINRMYGCSDTLLNSYNCNYEDPPVCGYVQDFDSDNLEWLRYEIGDKSVPVPLNSPSTDATMGVPGEGTYMVLDTSGKTAGQIAEMRSMRFVTKSEVQCLQFSYYMKRRDTSSASMAVHIGTLDDINGTVLDAGDPIITLDANYGAKWQVERMTINAPSAYKIIFLGKTDIYNDDVIAIDDVSIQDKPCEDGYFVIQDYSTILNTYNVDDSLLSPVMTSAQGYNFRLKIYPNGRPSSVDGYMSMYFGLVQGPKDDDLTWPFCNKFVRMMIVDQNDNPLYALNNYAVYLTSQTAGGDLWNKPTSNSSGFYGYSNFMKINELKNTNNYLKHDSLMVSVLIQDMNWVRGDVCNGTFARSSSKAAPKMEKGKLASLDQQELQLKLEDDDDNDEEHHEDHHHHEEHNQEHHHHDEDHHGDEHHHDEHHNHHEDEEQHEDDNSENLIPIGTAVGIAIGLSFSVLLVMSGILCCVVRSHKQNMKCVANNVVVHAAPTSPPAYHEDKVTFEDLPNVKI